MPSMSFRGKRDARQTACKTLNPQIADSYEYRAAATCSATIARGVSVALLLYQCNLLLLKLSKRYLVTPHYRDREQVVGRACFTIGMDIHCSGRLFIYVKVCTPWLLKVTVYVLRLLNAFQAIMQIIIEKSVYVLRLEGGKLLAILKNSEVGVHSLHRIQ